VETAGGVTAVVVGKPEPVVFEIAREALAGCERVAVVGDHLVSDIAGAKRAGLGAILVLTGTTARADLDQAEFPPDVVLESLVELPQALAILGNGQIPSDGLQPHDDLLAEFPYLGPPQEAAAPAS
jgi:4-nitrophenyl phosphatase